MIKTFNEFIVEEFKTVKTHNGEFDCYWNDTKTKYKIFNGSMGASGKGNNVYGIEDMETQKITWTDTLQKAKKNVKFWLTKANKE